MSPRTKKQVEKIRTASTEKILNAALELFAEHGYDSTSISQIASRAEVSKGLMYNYFSSKEDLLKKLIAFMGKGEEDAISEIHSENPSVMLENIIRIFFNELRTKFQQWVLISKLAVQIERFDFVKELAQSKYDGYITLFTELLGRIGIPNPHQEAKLLGALFDGIGMQKLFMGTKFPIDDMEDYLIEKYCKL